MVADTSTGAEGDQLLPEAIELEKAPSEVVMKDPSTRDIPKTSQRKNLQNDPLQADKQINLDLPKEQKENVTI